MFFHIGLNTYIWSECIIGIFDIALFKVSTSLSAGESEGGDYRFPETMSIIDHGLRLQDAKSCVLVESHVMHLSNIHHRSLKKRWKTTRKEMGNLLDKSVSD
jgi:hypothetical protein